MVVSSRPRSRRHLWVLCLVFLLVLVLLCQGRVVSLRFEMTLRYSTDNDSSKLYAPNATLTTHRTSEATTGPLSRKQEQEQSNLSLAVNGTQEGANVDRQFFNGSNRVVLNSTNARTNSSLTTTTTPPPLADPLLVLQNASHSSTTSTITRGGTSHTIVSSGRLFLSHKTEPSSPRRHGPGRNNTPISIVVQLSGEMGNHLHKIAMGHAIQRLAKDRYDIDTVLVLQRQERGSKWISARRDIQDCFPNLRSLDFELGNGPEFVQRSQQQQDWLGAEGTQLLHIQDHPPSSNTTTATRINVDRALEFLQGLLLLEANHETWPPTSVREVEEEDYSHANTISLPFIYSQAFVDFHFIDQYWDDFRQLFALDEASCCSSTIRPDSDESVFHFRNYMAEMPRKGKQKGFEELSPAKTAKELLGHLQPGDKVALTSRVYNNATQDYADALEQQLGLQVRVIVGNRGVEDFCFLIRTEKELAGIARSTFLQWAVFLGTAQTAYLYSIDSPATRHSGGDPPTKSLGQSYYNNYTWTNQVLRNKVQMVLFQSEEMEALEQQQ